ncbi:MAG: hypothetical protein KKE62_19350 [Proteobacteria bacterium]|nr:hypothetical protein [Pseudomonadota bacterium]MBU1390052.1 hypothetical protein [Pseudomonadota bacterium]MBU1544997.1 hypothetical protein [Pseudomonadota bacterium]MBU2480979.1 hypothetical protein [Pseudomonadota bacterium]
MDLDTLITVVIFLLFFVFPTVLKILVQKKKDSRPSFLGKMGDQIQKFVQDLEQQGQQPKQTESENVWDMFETPSEPLKNETIVDTPSEQKVPPPKSSPEKIPLRTFEKAVLPKKQNIPLALTQKTVSSGINMSIKADPLQNAVVWSEILASPLALRNQ